MMEHGGKTIITSQKILDTTKVVGTIPHASRLTLLDFAQHKSLVAIIPNTPDLRIPSINAVFPELCPGEAAFFVYSLGGYKCQF